MPGAGFILRAFTVAMLVVCSSARLADGAEKAASRNLTSAADILALSPTDAARSHPVQIEGVLIAREENGAMVVHDGTQAIYVVPAGGTISNTRRNSKIRVRGFSHPGAFAPIVSDARCEYLGSGQVPNPIPVTFADLSTGRLDGQWVEVEGVLRTVWLNRNETDVDAIIATGGGRVPLRFQKFGLADAERLVDASVRIRGVCFHLMNRKRQRYGMHLLVPEEEPPTIIVQPPGDPFALPVQSSMSLLSYHPSGTSAHRIHLQGRVTYIKPGDFLFLQDATGSLCVKSRQATEIAIGQVIDVAGFAAMGVRTPVLEDAQFRTQTNYEAVLPRRVTMPEILHADSELISVEGTLIEVLTGAEGSVLVMRQEQQIYNAQLDCRLSEDEVKRLPTGSKIALTGICRVVVTAQAEDHWKNADSFRVLLRSPSDIELLKHPPWWASTSSLRLVLITVVGLLVIVLAMAMRARWKLRGQQMQQAEMIAIQKERNRLAREIHDTLAQAFTSVSAQIEMAKQRLGSNRESAVKHLELARLFVCNGLAEARRSIWGLRTQVLESRELPDAIREVGQQLTAGSLIDLQVRTIGNVRRLLPAVEVDLLRIAQEALTNAVRHAQPTRITINVEYRRKALVLEIWDDGRGCDLSNTINGRCSGFGLVGIRERAAQVGGILNLTSSTGQGTRLHLLVPIFQELASS